MMSKKGEREIWSKSSLSEGHFIRSDKLKKNKITWRKARYGPILLSTHVEGPLLQISESHLAHGCLSLGVSSSMMPSTEFQKLTPPQMMASNAESQNKTSLPRQQEKARLPTRSSLFLYPTENCGHKATKGTDFPEWWALLSRDKTERPFHVYQ